VQDILDQFQAASGKTAAEARTDIINYFFDDNSGYAVIISKLSPSAQITFKNRLQRIYFNKVLDDATDTKLNALIGPILKNTYSDLNSISQLKAPEWAKDIISNPAEYLLAEARVRGLG
jgi:hypothetical protein